MKFNMLALLLVASFAAVAVAPATPGGGWPNLGKDVKAPDAGIAEDAMEKKGDFLKKKKGLFENGKFNNPFGKMGGSAYSKMAEAAKMAKDKLGKHADKLAEHAGKAAEATDGLKDKFEKAKQWGLGNSWSNFAKKPAGGNIFQNLKKKIAQQGRAFEQARGDGKGGGNEA